MDSREPVQEPVDGTCIQQHFGCAVPWLYSLNVSFTCCV